MTTPYIGEMRMFGGTFAPGGWAVCAGALMPIADNDAMFTLIGTTYGGDGQTTFALPNLQSRVPVHMGQGLGLSQNYTIGEQYGVESETLTVQQTPAHSHALLATTSTGNNANANGNMLAADPTNQ